MGKQNSARWANTGDAARRPAINADDNIPSWREVNPNSPLLGVNHWGCWLLRMSPISKAAPAIFDRFG